MFKKNHSHHDGFTLPEVIVAMGVLVMVIVASTQLLVTIIRNNNDNVDTLTAYELAQEGLEAVRNVRDSDWLLGADFQGKIDAHFPWGDTFPAQDETRYYIVDTNLIQKGACSASVTLSTLANCAPWVLKEVSLAKDQSGTSTPDPAATQLYLQPDQGVFRYVHTAQLESKPSLFHRYLKITTLEVDPKDPTKTARYRVSAFVTWQENLRAKSIALTTELSDWKGGPL